MKLAFVSNSSWYVHNLRLGVLKALKLQGIEVVVIFPVDDSSLKLINEGFKLIPLKLDNSGRNPFKDLKVLLTLKRLYTEHKFDFIFHYTVKLNIYGTLAASFSGLNSTAISSGRGHSFLNKGFLFSLTKLMYRCSLHLADEV